MFWILTIVGGIGLILCALWLYNNGPQIYAIIILMIFTTMVFSAWTTPQGKVYSNRMLGDPVPGNWLIIDDGSNKTMRHWVLKNKLVENADRGGRREFIDIYGNLCQVPRDAYAMRINQPLEEFLKNYKILYSIPAGNIALQ